MGLAPAGARSGPGLPTGGDSGTPGAMAGAGGIPGVAAGACGTPGAMAGAGATPGAVPGAFITPVGAKAGMTGSLGALKGAVGVILMIRAAMPSSFLACKLQQPACAPAGARSGPGLPIGEDCGTPSPPGAMAGANEIPGVAGGGSKTPTRMIGASGVLKGGVGVALGAVITAMPSNFLACSSIYLPGSTSCLEYFDTAHSSITTNEFPPDTHAPTVLVSSQRKPVSSHSSVLAPCKAAATGGLAGLGGGWSSRGFSSCAWLLKTIRSAVRAKSLYLVMLVSSNRFCCYSERHVRVSAIRLNVSNQISDPFSTKPPRTKGSQPSPLLLSNMQFKRVKEKESCRTFLVNVLAVDVIIDGLEGRFLPLHVTQETQNDQVTEFRHC